MKMRETLGFYYFFPVATTVCVMSLDQLLFWRNEMQNTLYYENWLFCGVGICKGPS